MRTFLWSILALLAASNGGLADLRSAESCNGTHYYFISDSHGLGPFGESLDQWLRAQMPARIDTYSVGGSSPRSWTNPHGAQTPFGYTDFTCSGDKPLKSRLKTTGPLHVPALSKIYDQTRVGNFHTIVTIVALGTNVIPSELGFEMFRNQSIALLQTIAHEKSKCFWIGPPKMRDRDFKSVERTYQEIQAAIDSMDRENRCVLIDSRKYSEFPKNAKDGIHYRYFEAETEAKKWADGVISEILKYGAPERK